jgi:hypothetical protein
MSMYEVLSLILSSTPAFLRGKAHQIPEMVEILAAMSYTGEVDGK